MQHSETGSSLSFSGSIPGSSDKRQRFPARVATSVACVNVGSHIKRVNCSSLHVCGNDSLKSSDGSPKDVEYISEPEDSMHKRV